MFAELTQIPSENRQQRHRHRRSSHHRLFPRHHCDRLPAVLRALDYCPQVGLAQAELNAKNVNVIVVNIYSETSRSCSSVTNNSVVIITIIIMMFISDKIL